MITYNEAGTYREDVSRKLTSYFKKKLGMYNYKNGWLKGDCPHCFREDKFGVNIGRDKTNCFICGEKTKPLTLIMELEGLKEKRQVWDLLRNTEELDPFTVKIEKLEHKEVMLPEGFKLLTFGDGIMAKQARDYMEKRGFDPLDLSMKGVGYCVNGKYSGCIILPFFENNKLVYFIGRKFVNIGEKFKNPEVSEFGIGKSQLLFNGDCLYIYKKVRVVESYINALTLGDSSTAILGKMLSNYQKSKILRSPVKALEIILDPDAYVQALQTSLDLVVHKAVKVVRLPPNTDVNDIGKKETLKIVKASKWLSYQDIYKLWLLEKSHKEYEESFA